MGFISRVVTTGLVALAAGGSYHLLTERHLAPSSTSGAGNPGSSSTESERFAPAENLERIEIGELRAAAQRLRGSRIPLNPGTGGVSQRRARARPNHCTLPAAASESSARCTVRWLVPSASASAELDQDSPSARKASTAACSSSTGRASTTTSRARRGASAKPALRRVNRRRASAATLRSRPIFDSQARAMRFVREFRSECARSSTSRGTSPGHASPSARASANNTGRVASEIAVPP